MFERLPKAVFQQVNAEFSGEQVLWAGQPDAWKALLLTTPILLFAIPWTVFAVGWEYIAVAMLFAEGSQAPQGAGKVMSYVFPVFGLPFVVIGLVMTGSPLWVWWKARRTIHVLTTRRLATVLAGKSLDVTSVEIGQIVSTTRKEKRDGSGTLDLYMGEYRDSDGDRVEKRLSMPGVPDVRELDRLISEIIGTRASATAAT